MVFRGLGAPCGAVLGSMAIEPTARLTHTLRLKAASDKGRS